MICKVILIKVDSCLRIFNNNLFNLSVKEMNRKVYPGGLNNMLMHISEDMLRQCFLPESSFLNSGSQFDSNEHEPHEFLSLFNLNREFPYKGPCYEPLTQINDKWYTSERVNVLEKLYKSISLHPALNYSYEPYDITVHARFEKDWLSFMCNNKRHCPSFSRLNIVPSTAFVVIGHKNTNPFILNKLGKYFKGFVSSNNSLSYTQNAAIHFFKCVNSRVFWGNSYSTFSRGIARVRKVHGRLSYAYDCSNDQNVKDLFIFSCDTHKKNNCSVKWDSCNRANDNSNNYEIWEG